MKFHLLSDLHLEFYSYTLTNPNNCDALILAGDIGNITKSNYKNLLKSASKLFKYTFVLKGNHECYNHYVDETDKIIQGYCNSFNNVYYLNKTVFDIDDIRIIGSTLWSNIQKTQKEYISMGLNDFELIKHWNIDLQNEQHLTEREFIENEIKTTNHKKLLIITHHAPSFQNTSSPEFDNGPMTSAFASNLDYLFDSPITWCYGHTHFSNTQTIKNTRLFSNQRGYPKEKTNFNKDFTFTL